MQKTEHNLGSLVQIPLGEGREFVVEGKRITIFRPRSGGLYATQAQCPHKQGPLAEGIVGGTTVICPYHAWKFDVSTGKGLPTNPGEGCLKTYPVRLAADDSILLTVSDEPDSIAGEKTLCGAAMG